MNDVAGSLSFASGGDFILTDDKAPVELLGIQVIDGLIQTEAAYYKKILQEKRNKRTGGTAALTGRIAKKGDDCGAGKEKGFFCWKTRKVSAEGFPSRWKRKDMRWFPVKVWHRRAGRLTFSIRS